MTKRDASEEQQKRSFPRKRLWVRGDTSNLEHDESIDLIIEEFKKRIRSCKTTLNGGNLDAPSMQNMIYLGKINDSPAPIYKVNVPGWIFRHNPTWSTRLTDDANDNYGAFYAKGKTGILLSYDPKYLIDNGSDNKANRILYMTAWDGKACSNANAMFPINPGSSTYMYLGRDLSIRDSDYALKEFYFIPSTLATCMNIHPDEYVVKVGETSTILDLVDTQVSFIDNPVVSQIFDGKFSDTDSRGHMRNFAAIRGWFRTRRDTIKFVDENSAIATAFYNSHPQSQLTNDKHEEYWRYGVLAARLTVSAAVNTIASESHDTLPWETRALNSSSITVMQNAFGMTGKSSRFTSENNFVTPDKLNWGYRNYTVAYYAEMYVVAGYTYTFSGSGETTGSLAIDGTVLETTGATIRGVWTASTTGWVPITAVQYAKPKADKSGFMLVVVIKNAEGKLVYSNRPIGNDDSVQLFRLPSAVTYSKYKQYNRFLKVKQLLI